MAASGRDVCRALERHGWVLRRIRGSHHIYSRDGVDHNITVPVHGNQDLKKGTLHKILKDAGLTEDDL